MYRVCWSKKDMKVECSTQCYGIVGTEHITMGKRLDKYNTTLEFCNPLLPDFLDLIRAENKAKIKFEKYFNKKQETKQ